MNTEGFKRKLTAILSADVAGYSKLMGQDEEATVRTLTAHREMMAKTIEQHRGRVVDSPGDNLLAEFASVVDAVQCAVEIQQVLKVKNADIPEERRMEFRIGINLGDVIEEGERIYGDGVNIAARVEGLAQPGGICISGTVYEHIKDKLALWEEFLGEHEVKNIKNPVSVYRIGLERGEENIKIQPRKKVQTATWKWAFVGILAVLVIVVAAGLFWKFYYSPAQLPQEEATVEEPEALQLPDKPSIAVLPFANISGDPEQEYFSDGMTEEIITALSKIPGVFVIARNSTFTYKGKSVMVQQVGKDLGVKYVLEGSVRKSGDRVRIMAQLIDAQTGHHLWAERYDRELTDIFAVQDEITMKILSSLQVELTEGEQALALSKGTDNLQAYLQLLQVMNHVRAFNREDNMIARRMASELIAEEPSYGRAYSLLGLTHFIDVALGSSPSPKESLVKAMKLAQKAIAMDESDGYAHALVGYVYAFMRKYEKAIAEAKRAVALGPNDEFAHRALGFTLRYDGRWEEAIPVYEKAIRLNPFPLSNTLYGLAMAHIFTGSPEKAVKLCNRAINVNSTDIFAHLVLTFACVESGRDEDARATARKIRKMDPQFSLKKYAKGTLTYKDPADTERFVAALSKAGLK
jgi:adenylate cyclase